jgi:hypothetical protein
VEFTLAKHLRQRPVMNRMTENKNWAGNGEKFAFEKMTLFAVVYGKCARSGL